MFDTFGSAANTLPKGVLWAEYMPIRATKTDRPRFVLVRDHDVRVAGRHFYVGDIVRRQHTPATTTATARDGDGAGDADAGVQESGVVIATSTRVDLVNGRTGERFNDIDARACMGLPFVQDQMPFACTEDGLAGHMASCVNLDVKITVIKKKLRKGRSDNPEYAKRTRRPTHNPYTLADESEWTRTTEGPRAAFSGLIAVNGSTWHLCPGDIVRVDGEQLARMLGGHQAPAWCIPSVTYTMHVKGVFMDPQLYKIGRVPCTGAERTSLDYVEDCYVESQETVDEDVEDFMEDWQLQQDTVLQLDPEGISVGDCVTWDFTSALTAGPHLCLLRLFVSVAVSVVWGIGCYCLRAVAIAWRVCILCCIVCAYIYIYIYSCFYM